MWVIRRKGLAELGDAVYVNHAVPWLLYMAHTQYVLPRFLSVDVFVVHVLTLSFIEGSHIALEATRSATYQPFLGSDRSTFVKASPTTNWSTG